MRFAKAAPAGAILSPSDGLQFFGHVQIDGASGQMSVTLRDRNDVALWSTTMTPG